jgi:TDG/mug DNA glycosylase family protein
VSLLRGFAGVGAESPRILILGSFPSEKSLERGEYYGNERNHFWPLLGSILGFAPTEPYAERLARLERAGIALWDVIASCEREGSLDQDIREELPNPLSEYVGSRPSIARLALNGGKAAASFVAHVAPYLRRGTGSRSALRLAIGETESWSPDFALGRAILVARLPSSSPVPSGRFRGAEDKLPAWSAFLASSP